MHTKKVILIFVARCPLSSKRPCPSTNGFDVWQGVWRCTHAKLTPLTPHPLARDRHYGPASGQREECFGAGNFSVPISPLLLKCADGATTLSLRSGSIRISGSQAYMGNWLPDVSEVDRPGLSSASVAGLLMAKTGGMARSGIGCWVVAAMGCPCCTRAISI